MSKPFLIFTTMLTAACAAQFNPDLSETGASSGAEEGSGTAGSDSDETGDTDPTGGLDMNEGSGNDAGDGDGDGDGDGTDSSSDTEESSETGAGISCGDNVAEGEEECDGSDLLGASCEDNDLYGGGQVSCSMDCLLDFSDCNELLYEQNFFSPNMPAEVTLAGDIPFGLIYGEILDGYMGQWNGACFHGADDYCMQAGAITHSQTSTFSITLDFAAPGEVRFWAFGWSESTDWLEFSIDNQVVEMTGGQILAPVEWVHPINSTGMHQLKWAFRKDGSNSEGFDTVWVDSITVTNGEPV